MFKRIEPHETEIVGNWIATNGRVEADEACRRIWALVHGHLTKLATDSSGWEALYRDPSDNRFWEHTYPLGHMHGGGPPTLRMVSAEVAKAKYSLP
jgi:hypothetical protein